MFDDSVPLIQRRHDAKGRLDDVDSDILTKVHNAKGWMNAANQGLINGVDPEEVRKLILHGMGELDKITGI
jgi:hypothetical protein